METQEPSTSRALVPTNQHVVQFNGDQLVTIQSNGMDYVALKPICDALGIDVNGQRQRIQRDEVLSKGACIIHAPSEGGEQLTFCLGMKYLNGWLFGVGVNQIRPEAREKLIEYKSECYDALYHHFHPEADPSFIAELRRIIARLDANDARQQVQIDYLQAQYDALKTKRIGMTRRAMLMRVPTIERTEERILHRLKVAGPQTVSDLQRNIAGSMTNEAIKTVLEALYARGLVASTYGGLSGHKVLWVIA